MDRTLAFGAHREGFIGHVLPCFKTMAALFTAIDVGGHDRVSLPGGNDSRNFRPLHLRIISHSSQFWQVFYPNLLNNPSKLAECVLNERVILRIKFCGWVATAICNLPAISLDAHQRTVTNAHPATSQHDATWIACLSAKGLSDQHVC